MPVSQMHSHYLAKTAEITAAMPAASDLQHLWNAWIKAHDRLLARIERESGKEENSLDAFVEEFMKKRSRMLSAIMQSRSARAANSDQILRLLMEHDHALQTLLRETMTTLREQLVQAQTARRAINAYAQMDL